MLYSWASHLREESKELQNGLKMLKDAKQICMRAINTLPGENSKEDINKYLKLKESIDFYIDYEETFAPVARLESVRIIYNNWKEFL